MNTTCTDDQPTVTGSRFEVDHLYCCDPLRAWCGADLTNEVEHPTNCEHDACALCLLAENQFAACACQGEPE